MSFHFLGNVINKVEGVARGDSKPGGGTFGFLEKNIAQPIVNNAKTLEHPSQIYNPTVNGLANSFLVNAPKVAVGKITHNQTAVDNANANLKKGQEDFNKNISNPLFLGSVGGESIKPAHAPAPPKPFNFLNKEQPDTASNLIKASTKEDAHKALVSSGVDELTAERIAPAVAQTKDPNVISNIITRAHTPPPTPQDIIASRTPPAPPTPVGEEISAGQARANEATNSFLQTVRNADSTSKELSDAVGGLKQTHAIRDTEQLSTDAQKAVEKDYTGSLTQVLTSKNPTDVEVAMGEHLITQAQKAGNIGEAVNLAEHLDTTLREHGRAIQAASIMSRLSPEGRLLAVTRKVGRAREGHKNAPKETGTAKELKQQIEKPIDQQQVKQTVKDLANEPDGAAQRPVPRDVMSGTPEELTTGEQLAKKVDAAASPPKPKKATDALVQELTKKVKQEYLDPAPTLKKDPLAILKETFGRSEEAKAAYPEAQQILRDKYADNPQMSEALDKFFGSELDHPAASSTINSAIKNQLKSQGDKVSEIIYKSHVQQGETVATTAQRLVQEGFDEASAHQLASEVAKRLDKQIHEAKVRTLEHLSKQAEGHAQTTFLEKTHKLSNLGALTDQDYVHLARAKLNLPHLNETSAAKISDLSQKIQSMSAGPEQYKLIRELHEVVNSNIPNGKGELFREIFAAPRSVLASADVSGLGRQGSVLGTRFPKEWGEAWKDSGKALVSQEYFDKRVAELNTKTDLPPEYLQLREKSGLAIAGGPDALHEEAFASTLPEKVPVLGKVVEGSDRAYTLGLSSLRDQVFESIYKKYEDIKPMSTWTDEEVKSLGRFINTASGRGDLGKYLENHGKSLQEALFSPKLWKSRLDLINPIYYYQLKGPARAYAAQAGVTFAGTAASIMALAVAAGADVETDPRSSDFLKIKVGDTRFDIMGGLQQNIVFVHRELPGSIGGQKTYVGSGEKKSSQTGKVTDLNSGKFGAPTRLSVMSDLFQSKENPTISQITTQVKGQDKSGNVLTPKTRLENLGSLAVPLSIGDTYNNITHSESPAGGVAKSIPGFFGIGVNSYGTQDINITGQRKEYLDKLQTQGADKQTIDANKQFFQILKSAPDKQTGLDQVHKAIDEGNLPKAQALAQAFNNKYDSYIQGSGWVDDNSQYITPVLEKEYNKGKIYLTSTSVKAYLRSKEGL